MTEKAVEEKKEAQEEAKPVETPKAEATEAKPEAKPEKTEEKPEAKAEKKEEKPKEEKKEVKEEKKEEKEEAPVKEKKVEKKAAEEDVVEKEFKSAPRENTLVPSEKYLKAGVHIGTRFKTGEMKRFIYKERRDGLKVLNVQTLDERIRVAASFLSNFDLDRIIVVARKLYGQTPAQLFAEAIGARALTGRFVPGSFTNPQGKEFLEPQVIIVSETDADFQAIKEASAIKVPVVALASTNNTLKDVDLVIPVNNKGRKSIALVYWLLAKELLKAKGEIKKDSEFKKTLEDFEFELKEDKKERPQRRFDRRGSRGRDQRRGGRRR